MIYNTPAPVAHRMARFVPQSARRILEPAVGNGALLKALLHKLKARSGHLVVVDLDKKALAKCREILFPSGWVTLTHNTDYLSLRLERQFDCVIMNPPFASQSAKWVTFSLGNSKYRCAIEAAFVLKAISLLKEGGRMVGLLPASLISGSGNQWFRNELAKLGSIKVVHELPERTFPGTDVKTYLLVFDKCGPKGPILLLNHSLENPDEIPIARVNERLDFSYHEAKGELERLCSETSLVWRPVGEMASIHRGEIETPTKVPSIHTTDYRNGFWKMPKTHSVFVSQRAVMPGDILVKRVSRNCASSFGVTTRPRESNATDCIIILRPLKKENRESLLFSLRVFFGWKWARAFIEKGTGASFISQGALRAVKIPTNLHSIARASFLQYRRALQKKNHDEMRKIESRVRSRFSS
jgi:hypothetical protein